MQSLWILVAFLFTANSAPREVNAELKKNLNAVLEATNQLHSALYSQDSKQIDTAVERALKAIGSCMLQSKEEYHLKKILEAASTQLQVTRMRSGKNKLTPLKEVFRQVIQITRAYKTDAYRIFFCQRDRSVWLQKSWRAKNPFEPKGVKCGVLVR